MRLRCLALAVLAATANAQVRPGELREERYDLGWLVTFESIYNQRFDFGQSVSGAWPAADGVIADRGGETYSEHQSGWVRLISACLDPASGASADWDPDKRVLVVIADSDGHAEVRSRLLSISRIVGQRVEVEIREIPAEGLESPRPVVLDAAAAERVSESAPALRSWRSLINAGRFARIGTAIRDAFVRDADVEGSMIMNPPDPVVTTMPDGFVAQVEASEQMDGRWFVRLRMRDSDQAGRVRKLALGNGQMNLTAPGATTRLCAVTASIDEGGALLLSAGPGATAWLVRVRGLPRIGQRVAIDGQLFSTTPLTVSTWRNGNAGLPPLASGVGGGVGSMDTYDERGPVLDRDHVRDMVTGGRSFQRRAGQPWIESAADHVLLMGPQDWVRESMVRLRRTVRNEAATIEVEACAGVVDRATADALRSGAADLEAVAKSLAFQGRGCARAGDAALFADQSASCYVKDYDVEINPTSLPSDPIVDTVWTGTSIRVIPQFGAADTRILDFWLAWVEDAAPLERFETDAKGASFVEIPHLRVVEQKLVLRVERGRWTVACVLPAGAEGRSFACLVRAR